MVIHGTTDGTAVSMTRVRAWMVLASAAVLTGCGGTAATPERPAPAAEARRGASATGDHVEADVRFMQAMIVHHAQALDMTALVPARTEREEMRLLARRIEQSQQYEIGLMRRWLEQRGESVPDPDDRSAHRAHMAGIATPEQMQQLAAARGEAFERLFLQLMIRHHQGALVMVEQLQSQEGAGQEPELYMLVSHVDADQRAEIARMQRMLNGIQ